MPPPGAVTYRKLKDAHVLLDRVKRELVPGTRASMHRSMGSPTLEIFHGSNLELQCKSREMQPLEARFETEVCPSCMYEVVTTTVLSVSTNAKSATASYILRRGSGVQDRLYLGGFWSPND